MSTRATTPTPVAGGYLHEVGFYGSDEEFRELIVPFALDGLETDEPVVFAYDPAKVDLLKQWLPTSPSFTYVADATPYATPTKALVSWRRLIEQRLSSGATRVRIAGNVPHPGCGQSYAGWDRYETAVDRAIGDLPVWAPCLYDTRIAPADVIDVAIQRHRFVLDQDGTHRSNDRYEMPSALSEFLSPALDPLVQRSPDLEVVDPTPTAAREATRQIASALVNAEQLDDLLLAVSETVANATVHGVAPVTIRFWTGDQHIVVVVHDEGSGPIDPLAGLLTNRDNHKGSGRGLWLMHQLGIDVALITDVGFSVQIRVGANPRHVSSRS